MKANIERGSGFRGILNYLLDEGKKATGKKEPEIIGGNMTGHNARSLTREFAAIRKLRSDIKRPVWHCSLALPPGEKVANSKWSLIATRYMELMKLDPSRHQFVAIRHHDCDHDHIHILSNRINLAGRLWYGQFELYQSIRATQTLEQEFSLTITPSLWGENDDTGKRIKRRAAKKKPKKEEIEQAVRTGKAPNRLLLQEIIDEALKSGTQTIFSFIEQVEAGGAFAIPNVARTGRMNGFAFAINGIRFKGSDLGANYTWKQLQEQGVCYEQDKDCDRLIKSADRIKKTFNAINTGVATGAPAGAGAHERTGQSDGTRDSKHQSVNVADDRRNQESQHQRPTGREKINGYSEATTDLDRTKRQQSEDADKTGQRDSASSGTAKQPEKMARTPATTLNWGLLADHVADLAAPATGKLVANSPSHQARIKAWNQQHSVLQAEHYHLIIMPPADEKIKNHPPATSNTTEPQVVSAAEITDRIPELRRLNAQGHDIYITPSDTRYHYVVLDIPNKQALQKLRGDGYQPCLVQVSEVSSLQVVLKIPKKTNDQNELSLIDKISAQITGLYGSSGKGAEGRLKVAGFANNKEPGNIFTQVIEAVDRFCRKTKEILEKALKRDTARKKQQQRIALIKQQIDALISGKIQNLDSPQQAFQAHWREFYEETKAHQQKNLRLADIDSKACLQMLLDGWDVDDVTKAMSTLSPALKTTQANEYGYQQKIIQKTLDVFSENQKPGSVNQEVLPTEKHPLSDH